MARGCASRCSRPVSDASPAALASRHEASLKDRNVIERCYCRLKDFRRIATRYDKLARNYFSALCLVAAVAFWL
ncbi:transposase [Bradyrhizobium sp. KBS0727]|nr:transposase [Bradyrhizobium sp. KBS0725]QDW43135.1 transposase [Bradyrhizobium sp. KBS0727]